MRNEHAITSVALIAALAGATGCGARSGPAGEVPEAPTAAAPAATAAPGTGAADAPADREAAITVEDFAYELPSSVAPGATVTVINEGDATHTVTAEDGSFEAVVGSGETATFLAPERAGDYAVACAYHPEMSGTLTVG